MSEGVKQETIQEGVEGCVQASLGLSKLTRNLPLVIFQGRGEKWRRPAPSSGKPRADLARSRSSIWPQRVGR